MSTLRASEKPNILFISADDMSYDSLGCTGCAIPDISPNLDGLARQGLLLDHCHIVSPVCGPSRRAWITGALPHQTGYMGHYNMPPRWFGKSPIKTNVAELLRTRANYFTGVICKIPDDLGWDWRKGSHDTGVGRDASRQVHGQVQDRRGRVGPADIARPLDEVVGRCGRGDEGDRRVPIRPLAVRVYAALAVGGYGEVVLGAPGPGDA